MKSLNADSTACVCNNNDTLVDSGKKDGVCVCNTAGNGTVTLNDTNGAGKEHCMCSDKHMFYTVATGCACVNTSTWDVNSTSCECPRTYFDWDDKGL
jgi:hypothetical protein